ncbi:methionyl-tRNA formyltransferase [bacterium]|nr:MAG: methionyl-tRNA formyltransferase [bacterium]
MKIIFIGTGKFGAIVLEKLVQSKFRPDFLICPHDKPAGRKQILRACLTKEIAKKYNLEIAELNTLKGKEDLFKKLAPNLIIVADTNFILPKEILKIPQNGCLNIHPSLLPKYRGSSPIQTTILAGDKKTGTTIILMDEKIDHGNIIKNKKLNIKNKIFDGRVKDIQYKTESAKPTYEILRDDLAELGAELLIKILPDWLRGKIKSKEQEHNKATYTKKLTKQDGQIDWSKPAIEIERQVRALNPWPGTYTFFEHKGTKKRLKILAVSVLKINGEKLKNKKTGNIIKSDKKMIIVCGEGFLILEQVQPEGKNPMSGETFLNGYGEIDKLN